jgi:hypothetical protein
MKVEILDGIGNPIVLRAARVLITMDDGTPVCVALEWMPNHITCAHAMQGAEFRQMLVGLGIDRTTIVTTLDPKQFAL